MVLVVIVADRRRAPAARVIASARFCAAAKISGVCPHSASLAFDVGAAVEQDRHHVGVAGGGGQMQRRDAGGGGPGRRRSAPAFSSACDDGGAARLAGQVQRRVLADARRRRDVRAGVDQHVGHLGVAAFGRPVQRGHAVALRAR